MGPAKASSDLIACIDEEIEKCPDDELLASLAEQLGKIRDHVAAKPDLLPTLEKLCKADETLVRMAAVESLRFIGLTMNVDEINGEMAPLVKRLLAEAWWTSKVSAAGLLATAYAKANPDIQAELKTSLSQITKDETPMVRRAVATNLGALCAVLEPECVLRDLFPSFNKLANDDQDSVRILTFNSCVQMCESQPTAQCEEFIHPAIDNFGKDASWRVRLEVARALDQLVEAIPNQIPVTICVNLLRDPELDVRRFALDKVPIVLTQHPDVAESSGILAAVAELADVDVEVPNALLMKTTLAAKTLELSVVLGAAITQAHLVPITVKLIQEDAVEIRIAILEEWTELVKNAGGETVLSALPLAVLAEDQSWRVRRSFLSAVPLVAAEIARGEFDSQILPLLKKGATVDAIASVRQAGFQVLADLVPIFGDEFAKGTSLPMLSEMAGNTTFGMRITACQVRHQAYPTQPVFHAGTSRPRAFVYALVHAPVSYHHLLTCLLFAQAIGMMADAGASGIASEVTEMCVKLCADTVPNVRFNAAWAAGKLGAARLCDTEGLKAALTVRDAHLSANSNNRPRSASFHAHLAAFGSTFVPALSVEQLLVFVLRAVADVRVLWLFSCRS